MVDEVLNTYGDVIYELSLKYLHIVKKNAQINIAIFRCYNTNKNVFSVGILRNQKIFRFAFSKFVSTILYRIFESMLFLPSDHVGLSSH